MSQLEFLKNKVKKWGGQIKDVQTSYATGTVTIILAKDGQTFKFPFQSKTAKGATEVLAWSIRTLINCDERGILPFQKTAHEFLQLSGSTDPFVEAEEKYFVTLGLSNKASNYEIIKAYKAFAKDLHPDTFAGLDENLRKDAENKFAELTEAYNAIKKARRF